MPMTEVTKQALRFALLQEELEQQIAELKKTISEACGSTDDDDRDSDHP